MSLVTYNLDTGGEGTTCTTANTGCNVISLGAGSTAIFRAAAAAFGPYGVRINAAAGTSPVMRWPLAAANNQVSVQIATTAVKELTSGNASYATFFSLRHSSGTVCSLQYVCDDAGIGKRIRFIAGASGAVIGELLTSGVSPVTQYWYTIIVNNSTGNYSVKMYDAGRNLVGSISGIYGSFNTAPFTHVQAGSGWAAFASTQDIDHVQADDGSATEISLPPVPPEEVHSDMYVLTNVEWSASPPVVWDGADWR